MSDEVDVSNDNIERDVGIATKLAGRYIDAAKFTGECLSCGNTLKNPKRWCDADCRDMHERRLRTHRR